MELLRSVPDLAAELSQARASISQCGYNTALDLVRTGVPALVVPYATPEEDEQTRRARRLEQLGVLKVATHINGDIDALLEFTPRPASLDLDGAARTRGAAVNALRPYVLQQWRALLGASAATLVLALAELAKPWPIALIVDHLIGERQAPFDVDMGFLAAVGALILAIAVAESAATYFSGLWMQSAGERITHELRVAVYDHLQRLSLAFHQRTHKGDLLTRVTEDVNDMGELFSDTLGEMLQSALLAAGMTIVLLYIDPVLALFSLVTAPLLVVVSFIFRRKVRERARRQRHHEGDLASVANETLSARCRSSRPSAPRSSSPSGSATRSEQRMGVGVEVARLQARFDGTVGVLRALATALVTVFGVIRVSKGELSTGDLIIFVSYTRKASSPMRCFAREASKLTAALARADRIAEILATDDVLEDGRRLPRAACDRRRRARRRHVRLRRRAARARRA